MRLSTHQVEKLLSAQACCVGAKDSPCCGPGVAEAIVGERRGPALRAWCYELIGCHADLDSQRSEGGTWRDEYLATIVDRTALGANIR